MHRVLKPDGCVLGSIRNITDSVTPWKCGKQLIWVVTCPNTLTPSYNTIASCQRPRWVANEAEKKIKKKVTDFVLQFCTYQLPSKLGVLLVSNDTKYFLRSFMDSRFGTLLKLSFPPPYSPVPPPLLLSPFPPPYSPFSLSLFLSLSPSLFCLVFAMFGMLSPASRGALMTAGIVFFMFMG